jgi:hypothetical protein
VRVDDDKHVAGVHCGNFSPACSATMDAAYQSGQFSSRCPIRFACSPFSVLYMQAARLFQAIEKIGLIDLSHAAPSAKLRTDSLLCP